MTAITMGVVSGGVGLTLRRRPMRGRPTELEPILACASLMFGAWYGLAALHLLP